MLELKKTSDGMFKEYYEGVANSGWKVHCILDDFCVRYMVFDNRGNRKERHEYKNGNKALCFKKATEALNRI